MLLLFRLPVKTKNPALHIPYRSVCDRECTFRTFCAIVIPSFKTYSRVLRPATCTIIAEKPPHCISFFPPFSDHSSIWSPHFLGAVKINSLQLLKIAKFEIWQCDGDYLTGFFQHSLIRAEPNRPDSFLRLLISVFNYSNIRKFSSNSIIQCESQAVLCYNSSKISKRINFSDKICLDPSPGKKGGTPCQRKCTCPQNPFRKSLPLSDPTSEN